jgi:polysaccharide chain length determinant protein (PEP-CTERM system associated)
MYPGKSFKPEQVLQLVWRHVWLLLWTVMLGTIAAALYAKTLPDRYVSVATVAIQPQRVPESIVSSSVPAGAEDRIEVISRDLRSRPSLERVIRDLRLAPPGAPLTERVIASVRGRIRVRGVRNDAFTIGFMALDPASAMAGAQYLTKIYLDENVRARDFFTQGTQEFLTTELEEVRARLLEQERRVVQYKRRNVGELPSQQPANLQAVQGFQAQLQSLRESINRDLDRRIVLERLLAEARTQPAAVAPVRPSGVPQSLSAQLADALARRRALELRLRPAHPDLQRLANEIQALEKQVAAINAQPAAPGVVDESGRDRRIRELEDDIRALGGQIASKEAQVIEVEATVADYQRRLENMPVRESELVELTRDYEATQELYQRLSTKSEEAKVAANLERQQIAEQFRVLEAPRLPERPEGPVRGQTVTIGALVGLMAGIGLLLLLEYRDSSLRTEPDVTDALGLPVLASIPIMTSAAERRRMHLGRFAHALAASAGAATCTVTVAWALGILERIR